VFPHEPERSVYHNALLERGLGRGERAAALDAMQAAYAAAGVTRYAAWVHESDGPMVAGLEQRGYTLDTTTRANRRPGPRRARPGLPDREPSVDPDGRARVRGRRVPRPRPDPRVRAARLGRKP